MFLDLETAIAIQSHAFKLAFHSLAVLLSVKHIIVSDRLLY